MENKITFKSVAWLLLFVFYLQFLVAEISGTVWSFFYSGPVPDYIMIIFTQLFAVGLPCAVYMFINSASFREIFKHKRLKLWPALMCVLAGVAAQPVASLCNVPSLMLMDKVFGRMPQPLITAPSSFPSLLAGIFAVALIPAIFEEALMRGIVLHTVEKGGYRSSLIITAFLFALLHNNLSNFLGMMFLGIVLCYAVWMTQSVFAGMLVHFSFNAFGMILDYIIHNNSMEHPWLGGDVFNITLIIAAVFLLGFSTSMLVRKNVKRYRTKRFFRQLISTVFNVPMVIIILGYIMFGLTNWFINSP